MTRADLPATETQLNLIDVFRRQLQLSPVEVDDLARNHGGQMDSLTRKVAGAVITDLQSLKAEKQSRERYR